MKRSIAVALFAPVLMIVPGAKASPPPRHATSAVARQASTLLDSVSTVAGPGAAILVDQGGNVLFRRARGSANIELGTPLTPTQVFRIASVTKIFTAALILKLAEEGRLSLDDKLVLTLPDFPNAQSITIRQLLSHTAGLSDKSLLGNGPSGILRQDMTLPALTSVIGKEPLRFAPGSSQAYANSERWLGSFEQLGAIAKWSVRRFHAAARSGRLK